MMMMLTIRFVPILLLESQESSIRSRGIDFETGGYFQAKNPLFLSPVPPIFQALTNCRTWSPGLRYVPTDVSEIPVAGMIFVHGRHSMTPFFLI
jgi:hypothetical protein